MSGISPLKYIKNFNAYITYLLSLTKSTWKLNDYPIQIRQIPVMFGGSELPPRLQWQAHIVNWAQIVGFGNTRNEALKNLEASFQSYKNEHEHLPGPGVKVPLEFETTSKTEQAFHHRRTRKS